MSTPTTARGALLRRAGTLLVAAVLIGAPASAALADPTAGSTADASPTASVTATATPDASPSAEASPTADPSGTTSPTPTSPAPSPTAPAPSTSPTSPTSSAPTTAPAAQRVSGISAARLADAAAAAAPQGAYAADFIARTLAAGDDHYVYPNSTFFDGGNTIDAILALDGVGAGADQADASFAYLEDNLGSYIGTDFGSLYAGSTAKTLLAVVAHGGDPTDFGGLDLVEELQAAEGAVEPGRFSDLPVDCGFDPCDYSNTIGQSLAVIALLRAGEAVSSTSVDFLLAQQCGDGGFRISMDGQACTSEADATAFAAQALIAAGSAPAAADALDWLADAQLASGAIASADGTVNANTTGVAAQAFAAGGRDTELADAQAFLVTLQYECTSPAALRGGIAFSGDDRSAATPSDTDLRATPQATLGLSGESLLSVTAEGASGSTTAVPCATSTTSPTDPTPSTSTGAPTEAAGGSDPSTTVGASATGALAQTGTDLLLPALLGLALVVIGGVAVVASTRRRGAHA